MANNMFGIDEATARASPWSRDVLPADQSPEDETGFLDLVGALYQEETIMGNAITLINEPYAGPEEIQSAWKSGYSSSKSLDRLLNDTQPAWADNLEMHTKLLEQPTEERFNYWAGELDQQARNDELMERSGFLSVLGAGAVAVAGDPFSWAINLTLGPLAAAGRTAKLMGIQQNAKTIQPLLKARAQALARGDNVKAAALADQAVSSVGHKSFGTAMRQSVLPATVDVSIAEFLAQEAQPDRGWEEAAINIGASAVFSGVLGGAAGVYHTVINPAKDRFITKYERKRGMAGAQELIDAEDSYMHPASEFKLENSPGQSVGAGFVYDGHTATSDPDVVARLFVEHGGDTPEFRYAKMKHERDHTAMIGGKTKKFGLDWVWRMHPSARLATSLSPEVRIIGQKLMEQDYLYEAIVSGQRRIGSVETATHLDVNTDSIKAHTIVSEGYNEILRKRFPDEAQWKRERSLMHTDLRKEYNNELSGYIYDRDHEFSADFEPYSLEIIQAANKLNRQVMAKWEKKRIDLGILEGKATPTDQRFYMQRKWNRAFTRRNSIRLERLLREEYRAVLARSDVETVPGQVAMFDTPPTQSEIIFGIIDHERDWSDELGPEAAQAWGVEAYALRDEMEADIEAFIQKVTGSALGHGPEGAVIESRALKARVVIPSKKLLQLDTNGDSFLVRDVGEITESFLRDAVPDYHLRKAFDDDGELTKTMTALHKGYAERTNTLKQLRNAATDEKVKQSYAKEIDDLQNDMTNAVRDIKDVVNVVKYNYGHPDDPDSMLANAGKWARTLNFVDKLGGMTISAFTDLAYISMKVGMGPTLKALSSRFRKSLINSKRGGITKADLNDLSIVTELFMHGKARAMFNMDDLQGMANRTDKWTGYISTQFSRVSMMNRWNHTMKEIAATAYVLKIRRHMNGTSTKDITFLRDMGFDDDQLRAIKTQWDTHGVIDGGVDAPNMTKWKDPKAVRAMRMALLRATDSAIVTPGAGDIPLSLRKQWGRLIFQFQSFPVSVLSRVAIPAIQRFPDGKAEVMSGMVMALSLGAMVSMIKDVTKGNEINSDPAHLMRQALDRSGLFGVYMTGWRMGEDVLGLNKMFTGEFEQFADSHRSRDPASEMLGPTYRTAQDALRFLRGLSDLAMGEGMSQGTVSSARRLWPGNNLFYADAIGRAAQEWVTGEKLK